jgi:hypothetical protein
MWRLMAVALTAAAVAGSGCAWWGESTDSAPPGGQVSRLSVEGTTGSGVSLAAAGQHLVATWAATSESRTNIYAAVSRDGGARFGPPVRVNDVDGDARVSGEQAPRVAIWKDMVVITWSSRFTGESRVRMAQSNDGGETFMPATTIHSENVTGARGWTSLAIAPDGAAHVAWLDGRNAESAAPKAPASGGASGAHAMHKSMRQDIFQAVIRPDGTQSEAQVATNVCFCCKTAVAIGPDGTTYVVWRHIYPTNFRDMAVARSTDDGKTFSEPVRVSEDHWQIDGCPEDGPSMVVTGDGLLHIAWPTIVDVKTARKAIFYSFSSDGGRSFAPRIRLDEETPTNRGTAHPQLARVGSSLVVAWDESNGAERRVKLRDLSSGSDDRSWAPKAGRLLTVSDNDPATYPAVAATADAMLVVWTANTPAGSEIRVRRLAR